MPRRKNKARRRTTNHMSFREICKKVGITPKQRVIMSRYFNKKLKQNSSLSTRR